MNHFHCILLIIVLISTVGDWITPKSIATTVSKIENNHLLYFCADFLALASSYDLDERDLDQRKLSVESSFKLDLSPHLIIPSASIKLNETIGQGTVLVSSFTGFSKILNATTAFQCV